MNPRLHYQDHIATITLQRPTVANRLAPDDLPVLMESIQSVNRRKDVRVLVLRSEGKYFCSGYDISQIENSQSEGSSFGEMVDVVEQCRAVTIAAIQGGVYGGATDLALACDFRVGSMAADMFMPAARLGLHFYASGMERYVSRLGLDTAKRLFLTGERLDAEQMKACGFLTHLAAPQQLDETVAALAETISAMAPLALSGMKKHLNLIASGRQDREAIARDVQRSVESADLREGGLAWREKRVPVFKGC
ncbi:enoyl-CoA hydratase/isomerase family protein [Comamonas testosteroni]|uniref:Methylmalonyl-CoA decarboxylase n=1 Tax=Comamonas testosteroni TaxID=285 RepID=A0A8B4S0P5_COMTE|nr:enoyl-CoA hydratase/isomerase family protein [Comamonas testosteroni]EHN66636.1 enoyl-CoA hydratase/isomerase [Comamonas testosteroni ATCC 11996]QQN70322.1 enoyl-CoA hydratase/isomerase family protein [Comamonas testosteroni]SUY75287.1 Methylmalonyl-CoA decarboxylase [Comamonas testosteroni]